MSFQDFRAEAADADDTETPTSPKRSQYFSDDKGGSASEAKRRHVLHAQPDDDDVDMDQNAELRRRRSPRTRVSMSPHSRPGPNPIARPRSPSADVPYKDKVAAPRSPEREFRSIASLDDEPIVRPSSRTSTSCWSTPGSYPPETVMPAIGAERGRRPCAPLSDNTRHVWELEAPTRPPSPSYPPPGLPPLPKAMYMSVFLLEPPPEECVEDLRVDAEELDRALVQLKRNKHASRTLSPLNPLRNPRPPPFWLTDETVRQHVAPLSGFASLAYRTVVNKDTRRWRLCESDYPDWPVNPEYPFLHCDFCKRDSMHKRLIALRFINGRRRQARARADDMEIVAVPEDAEGESPAAPACMLLQKPVDYLLYSSRSGGKGDS
ncbi:hypothetical protein PLICRDRAFT_40001 [Plicaturopsis crispa FD-325 SS-3]|nr:hypothetical protein PLICRDRAFT_40001 [Plicaturopsis crispa FD-325 SS-3]